MLYVTSADAQVNLTVHCMKVISTTVTVVKLCLNS